METCSTYSSLHSSRIVPNHRTLFKILSQSFQKYQIGQAEFLGKCVQNDARDMWNIFTWWNGAAIKCVGLWSTPPWTWSEINYTRTTDTKNKVPYVEDLSHGPVARSPCSHCITPATESRSSLMFREYQPHSELSETQQEYHQHACCRTKRLFSTSSHRHSRFIERVCG